MEGTSKGRRPMYYHKVQYYETDKMGITHHSNYVRWMEEARIDFMEKLGYGYDRLEAEGIISPVVSLSCDYKKSTTYPDVIGIEVKVVEFKGLKLMLEYNMTNQAGDQVFTATSTHCFLNENGRIIRISKDKPEFYEAINKEN